MPETLGDPRPQEGNVLLLQLEERAQVHLGRIDEIGHTPILTPVEGRRRRILRHAGVDSVTHANSATRDPADGDDTADGAASRRYGCNRSLCHTPSVDRSPGPVRVNLNRSCRRSSRPAHTSTSSHSRR